MSDFRGTSQREGGNWGKGKKGMSWAPQPPLPTKQSICNHYSSVTFFLSWADFFPPLIPARTGVAPTTQAPSDCDLIQMERLGNRIWLAD